MGKYLRKFETTAEYESAESTLVKPNVSYIVETNDVEYNPYVPPQPIVYYAPEKLTETTDTEYTTSGLHVNAFNTSIKSHTFENGVGTIEFDDDVTSIGQYAFYKCTSLTSIDIPNSVTSIGKHAFESCSGLTSIAIPDSVTSIGQQAFYKCTSLTSIEIPDSVTTIGPDAFNSCSSLTSVTIGNSVTIIGQYAFQNCSGLTSIVSNAMKAPTIQYNTFRNVKTGGTLTVPRGSSGYNVWMGTDYYYLGLYNWTKVEQ